MSGVPVSKLPDADMQAAPGALLRAAQQAREVARQTGTAIVIVRDGVLVEERCDDASAAPAPPPDISRP
jgi:hypothetical protein